MYIEKHFKNCKFVKLSVKNSPHFPSNVGVTGKYQ